MLWGISTSINLPTIPAFIVIEQFSVLGKPVGLSYSHTPKFWIIQNAEIVVKKLFNLSSVALFFKCLLEGFSSPGSLCYFSVGWLAWGRKDVAEIESEEEILDLGENGLWVRPLAIQQLFNRLTSASTTPTPTSCPHLLWRSKANYFLLGLCNSLLRLPFASVSASFLHIP